MTPEHELKGGLKIAASAALFIGFVLIALALISPVPV